MNAEMRAGRGARGFIRREHTYSYLTEEKRKRDKVMQILVSMPANISSHERGDASKTRRAIYRRGTYFSYVTEEKRKRDKVMRILITKSASISSHERGDASRSRSARIYPTGAYLFVFDRGKTQARQSDANPCFNARQYLVS